MTSKILKIAHRGFSAKYPENTLAAFQAAIDHNADMIELDVHLSKDNKLVVCHDFVFGRTCKEEGKVSDYTLADLQKMDVGSFFSNDFSSEKMPSLAQVITLLSGKISLNIEMKEESLTTNEKYKVACTELLSEIQSFTDKKLLVISSFDYNFLRHLREFDSRIKIGVLDHSPEKTLHLDLAKELSAYSYHCNYRNLDEKLISVLKSNELLVLPYTVNNEDDQESLIKYSVDGIISDYV